MADAEREGCRVADLSALEVSILRVCRGDVVALPYNDEQSLAMIRLRAIGLIESGYEDDQPTSWLTDAGAAALAGGLSGG